MKQIKKTKLQIQLGKIRNMIVEYERDMERELLKIYDKVKELENGEM